MPRAAGGGAGRWLAILLGVAVVGGAAVGATAGGDGSTARAAANVTITARDFFWSPDAVDIQVGDTVTCTNAQGFHNVLLGDSRLNQPGFPEDPSWNPPPKMTFNTPGSYTFMCEVHPGMTGTVQVSGGEPTPTPTATPTPTPAVPPPGGGAPDTTPPTVSGLTVSGTAAGARVRLTVSEPSTVNVRFLNTAGEARMRAQVEQGTWTVDHALANGRYTYELWAADAAGNRSTTEVGEVRVRG
jgi:plastocyanin